MKKFLKGESVQVQEDGCDCYAVDTEVRLCPLHEPSNNEESLMEAKERMRRLLTLAEEAQLQHTEAELLREMKASPETKDEEL